MKSDFLSRSRFYSASQLTYFILISVLNVVAESLGPGALSSDEIDVVRCMMNLVEKVQSQQDETLEAARECIAGMMDKVRGPSCW